MASPIDRITQIRVFGLRTLKLVTFDLDGLSVVIGANGAGKTSLVEACVLLRKVPSDTFLQQLNEGHGGLGALLRRGAPLLEFGVDIEGAGARARYHLALARDGGRVVVVSEDVGLFDEAGGYRPVVRRRGEIVELFDGDAHLLKVPEHRLVIGHLGLSPPPAVQRILTALNNIEVHRPFRTTPDWEARTLGESAPLRQARVLQPEERLSLVGGNLASIWHTLKNEKSSRHWDATMEFVRLGLGQEIDTVNVRLDAGGAQGALSILWKGQDVAEPAYTLSDGMLSWLCFVAVLRLEAPVSLLVFDEPETHLHPQMVQSVVGLCEALADRTGVLVCTHSDRLLDALTNPERSTVLLELDEKRAAKVRRPNAAELKEWLADYSGMGGLRAAGLTSMVFAPADDAP